MGGLLTARRDYFRLFNNASGISKPYEFIGFGAMDVTKSYEFIRFGAMDVTKAYEFIGFGSMDVTKPYEFIGFGAPGRDSETAVGPVWAAKLS